MRIASRTGSAAAVAVALASIALGGCQSDLLTENPPNIIVVDNLYTTADGFHQALNALYARTRDERTGASNNPAGALRAGLYAIGTDEAWTPYREPYTDPFNNWGSYSNSQVSSFDDVWTWLYRSINGANTIIDRAENPAVDWTPAEKDEIVAEARLFRAWAYRHLTYLWGDVPLNLHESTGANIRTDWDRAPRSDVLAQIEQDLLFAEAHLPATASDGRLTNAVASHYLAELYLWENQAAKAEAEARKVTDSGLYHLVTQRYGVEANAPGTPFSDMFRDGNVLRSQGNTEVLWAFNYEPNIPGGGQSIMRRFWVNRYYSIPGMQVAADDGGRGIGRIAPTSWSIKLYSPTDDRGSQYILRYFYLYNYASTLPKGKALGDTVWLNKTTEKANDYLWLTTRKWDGINPLDVNSNYNYGDQIYLRLGETYLLLAEAQFKQGNKDGAAATINLLRDRAHAPRITAADVTLDLILDERSRELLGEEQRRYTLIRTGTLIDRTKAHNPTSGPNIAVRDTLFPVPQSVIDANIGHPMPQNPGF